MCECENEGNCATCIRVAEYEAIESGDTDVCEWEAFRD